MPRPLVTHSCQSSRRPDGRSGRAENNEDGNYVCAIAT